MSALTAAPPARIPPTADRTIGACLLLIAGYLIATTWPAFADARTSRDARLLVVHLGLLIAALVLAAMPHRVRTLRDLLPLAVGAFLYVELRWLIPALGRPHADAIVVGWERSLFPTNPSASWAPTMPFVAL